MAQKSVWARIEKINRRLIPLALLLLLGIIIFELFIHSENETVVFWVKVADVAVITIFVVGQTIVHESLETEKLLAKSERFAKYGRILARGVRLSTKVWSGVRKGRN